jgi:hypothetical protein
MTVAGSLSKDTCSPHFVILIVLAIYNSTKREDRLFLSASLPLAAVQVLPAAMVLPAVQDWLQPPPDAPTYATDMGE